LEGDKRWLKKNGRAHTRNKTGRLGNERERGKKLTPSMGPEGRVNSKGNVTHYY
jgi:hypothetical protein